MTSDRPSPRLLYVPQLIEESPGWSALSQAAKATAQRSDAIDRGQPCEGGFGHSWEYRAFRLARPRIRPARSGSEGPAPDRHDINLEGEHPVGESNPCYQDENLAS